MAHKKNELDSDQNLSVNYKNKLAPARTKSVLEPPLLNIIFFNNRSKNYD